MTGLVAGALAWDGAEVPVDPDAPQARQWLIDELAKAEYQAAQPTWFDRLSKSIADWFASLQVPSGDGISAIVPLVVIVLAAALLVAAFLIFGMPRLKRRSTVTGTLFGAQERRNAQALRLAAEQAAASGDYALAVQEMFRALARNLAERTIVTVLPGTTAQGFARRAAEAFPLHHDQLEASAGAFDGVRYLGRAGSQTDYEALAALEHQVRAEKPATRESPQMPVTV